MDWLIGGAMILLLGGIIFSIIPWIITFLWNGIQLFSEWLQYRSGPPKMNRAK